MPMVDLLRPSSMNDLSLTAPVPAPAPSRRLRGSRRSGVIRAALLVFALTALLIGTLAFTLMRNGERSNVQQAETELAGGARVAASAIVAVRANLRAEAGQLATSLALQRALVEGDNATLARIARNRHAQIHARSTVIGSLPKAPRLSSSATISEDGHVLAYVAVGVPFDAALLTLVASSTPLPPHAALMLARGGRILAGGPVGDRAVIDDGRITLGSTQFVVGSASLGVAHASILAVEPMAAVDAQGAAYRRTLLLAALITLALAAGLATRLGRPLARRFGELSRQASSDALTGLANRRTFDERLEEEIERAARLGTHLALVLVDVDDFKRVNDVHGHQAGDDVLRAISHALRAVTRELDLTARLGGEEFALLLPGTTLDNARTVAEHVRLAISQCSVSTASGEELHVTASFGASEFPTCGTIDTLIATADRALYEAKRDGKDRVVAATA
jgi:diguanylate cyclase (GGDEF)-like protein